MHFLARLLKGDAAVAEELAKDEQTFHEELARFMESYRVKEHVLDRVLHGESILGHLHRLQYALREETRIVEQTEHTEHEIMQDLKYLSREHYIRRLEEVCARLNNAETRDEYARHILSELHETLLSEARKVRRLLHGEHDLDITNSLIDLFLIERHLVSKLASLEDFRQSFGDLFIGTKRKEAISRATKRFREKVRSVMQRVDIGPDGATPTTEHYLAGLTARVMNKLEDAVMEAVRKGYIRQHPHVDLEFVNSPLFVRFVTAEVQMDKRLDRLVPSQKTLETFVSVFRELYNRPVEVRV